MSLALVLTDEPVHRLPARTTRTLVVGLTEHVPFEDYPALRRAIESLGPSLRFAVDDAGAGFATFPHILELRPDFVKLDMGLVRGIERNAARQAFVAGTSCFAVKTRCAPGRGWEPHRRRTPREPGAVSSARAASAAGWGSLP